MGKFEMMVQDSSNVHTHSYKYESVGIGAGKQPAGYHPVIGGGIVSYTNCKNVSIFGGTGNFGITGANLSTSIIKFTNTQGIDIRSINRMPQDGEVANSSWITDNTVEVEPDYAVLMYTDTTSLVPDPFINRNARARGKHNSDGIKHTNRKGL